MADVIGRSNGTDEIRFLNPAPGNSWYTVESITNVIKLELYSNEKVNSWDHVEEIIEKNVSRIDTPGIDTVFGGVESMTQLILNNIKNESETIVECEDMAQEEDQIMYDMYKARD